MSGLSKEFLEAIGVHLDDEHFLLLTEHFNETLYARIENAVISSLSNDQIHQLAIMRDTSNDEIWQWLQANVPSLGDIVKTEVDAMLAEVVRSSDHF